MSNSTSSGGGGSGGDPTTTATTTTTKLSVPPSPQPQPPAVTPIKKPSERKSDVDDSSSLETDTSILLGVQALERQAQRKQNEIEALGVLALERQQAEVEARRRRTNSLSKSLTAPPASTVPIYSSSSSATTTTTTAAPATTTTTTNPVPPLIGTGNPFATTVPPTRFPPLVTYPPTVMMMIGGGRDPTVTTVASGSEGDGSNSFGNGSGNESWYINRDYLATKEEESEDGGMKRSGSVGRFLRNTKEWLKTGNFGSMEGGAFPNQEDEEEEEKEENRNKEDGHPVNLRMRMPPPQTANRNRFQTQNTTVLAPNTNHHSMIPQNRSTGTHILPQGGTNMETTTTTTTTITTHNSNEPNPTTKRVLQPLLYGYLHKRGRNGQWQRRWFEIDGKSLSYYKSKKHTSEADVLATLDLSRVGEILMDESDPEGCTFTIRVAKRNYYLHAETRDRAMDWVISLNRVREARLSIGGLTLIEPTNPSPSRVARHPHPTLQIRGKSSSGGGTSSEDDSARYRSNDEAYAARVGLVSGRERTKGYGKDDINEDLKSFFVQPTVQQSMVGMEVTGGGGRVSPTSSPKLTYTTTPFTSRPMYPPMSYLLPPVPEEIESLGRWEKRRSKIQNLTRRVSRWARRMTMIRCVIKDDVVPYANVPPNHLHHNAPHAAYMNYDPRYPHAALPFDYYSDAQHTGRSLGQISEGEMGSHSRAASANDDHDSVQNPPSVGSGEGVFTGYEKHKHRFMDDASNQSTRLSSGRGSPMAEDGVV